MSGTYLILLTLNYQGNVLNVQRLISLCLNVHHSFNLFFFNVMHDYYLCMTTMFCTIIFHVQLYQLLLFECIFYTVCIIYTFLYCVKY